MQRDSAKRPVMELVFFSLTQDEYVDEPEVVENRKCGKRRALTFRSHQLLVRNSDLMVASE